MTRNAQDLTILIVEPNPDGHRLYYVSLLARHAARSGARVVVATNASAPERPEWRVHLSDLIVDLVPMNGPVDLDAISRTAATVGANVTTIPDGDRYLNAIACTGWTGPGTLTMLAMRADAQPGINGWVRAGRGIAKKVLIAGANLQRNVHSFALRSPLDQRGSRFIRWVADPVTLNADPDEVARIRAQLDRQAKYWFGVFGVISARKNLPLILRALTGVRECGLLVAGSIEPDTCQAVAAAIEQFVQGGGVVYKLEGQLNETEFDSAIFAVDCVVAAHTNEGPSGVVAKAAAAGRRLVLSGAKSLRRDASGLRGQATWSPLEEDLLHEALVQATRLGRNTRVAELDQQEFVRKLTRV